MSLSHWPARLLTMPTQNYIQCVQKSLFCPGLLPKTDIRSLLNSRKTERFLSGYSRCWVRTESGTIIWQQIKSLGLFSLLIVIVGVWFWFSLACSFLSIVSFLNHRCPLHFEGNVSQLAKRFFPLYPHSAILLLHSYINLSYSLSPFLGVSVNSYLSIFKYWIRCHSRRDIL